MKKKVIYLLTLIAVVCCMTACVKEEEKKSEKPVEDVGALVDKYVLDETNENSNGEEGSETNSEENSESESIDYDKLDQELINQIIANGGKVTNGEEIANNQNPETNGNLEAMTGIYYSTEGFEFKDEVNGIRTYTGNQMLEAVAIYTYRDPSKTFTGAATINTIEVSMLNTYGNYIAKSTYVNEHGIEFIWYKYDETNKINNFAIAEVFLYSDGIQTIQVEAAANAALGGMSERIYNFIDSIRFQ